MSRSNRRYRRNRTRKTYTNELLAIPELPQTVPSYLQLVINNVKYGLTQCEFGSTSVVYIMTGPTLLNIYDTMFVTLDELEINTRIEPVHLNVFKPSCSKLGLECCLPLTHSVTLTFGEMFLTDSSYRLFLQPEVNGCRSGMKGFYFANYIILELKM
jgi:hypothetical protein